MRPHGLPLDIWLSPPHLQLPYMPMVCLHVMDFNSCLQSWLRRRAFVLRVDFYLYCVWIFTGKVLDKNAVSLNLSLWFGLLASKQQVIHKKFIKTFCSFSNVSNVCSCANQAGIIWAHSQLGAAISQANSTRIHLCVQEEHTRKIPVASEDAKEGSLCLNPFSLGPGSCHVEEEGVQVQEADTAQVQKQSKRIQVIPQDVTAKQILGHQK